MDWTIIIACLTAAVVCAGLLVLILRELWKELKKKSSHSLAKKPLDEESDRTATLMLRHSFVVTMLERYQDIGSSVEVIEYINDELRKRNAKWRVRALPDGNGEFYDLEPHKGDRKILHFRRDKG